MIMKKKILSLLVLLMTAATGAWAQQKYNVTFSGFDNASCNTTITDVTLPYSKSFGKTDACSNAYDIDGSSNNEQLVGASFGGDNFTITVKSAFEGTVTVSVGGDTESFNHYSRNITVACVPAAPPFDYTFSVADCDHGTGTVKFFIDEKEVKGANVADEGKTVTVTVTPDAGWIVDDTKVKAESYSTWEAAGAPSRRAPGNIQILGDVTLTKSTTAENTWTFTMPAASVLVSAAYIPVAAFAPAEPSGTLAPTAAEGVIAGEDKAIIVAGTVANIPETTNPQGTVKYFVTDNKDMTAEQAAKANGWVETLPTAAGYTGSYADDFQVYVWYYIQAATGYADSKPQRIEVTVQSNLFDLALNAANANTIEAGKATVTVGGTAATVTEGKLQGVKMGSEVKMTAKEGYKFRKVEVKKAAAVTYPLLSAATTSDIGKVVCAAGHLHDAKTAVPDGCTAVGIVGKVTSTGHGLILALKNATSQTWNTINGWTSASYAGTTLKVLPDAGARGNLSSYETLGETTVSNWAVAQKSDYEAIFTNLGSTVSDSYGTTYDNNVNAYITDAGGTAITSGYWSATYDGGNYSWIFSSEYWDSYIKSNSVKVRPVLGF